MAKTTPKKCKLRRRWVYVPVPPTEEMLKGITEATFLNDGSLIEMERRFNGMIDRLPVKRGSVRKLAQNRR